MLTAPGTPPGDDDLGGMDTGTTSTPRPRCCPQPANDQGLPPAWWKQNRRSRAVLFLLGTRSAAPAAVAAGMFSAVWNMPPV
ncbi:hypothetical protein GCM10009731_26780 [Streptomyces globosus]